MRRRRVLDPEEERLWQEVARTVRRRHPPPAATGEAAAAGPPPAVATPQDTRAAEPLAPFRIGARAPAAPPAPARPVAQPLGMDARLHARMTRGRLAPEARIDLHGLTLAEAHPELVRFLLDAQARGQRLVLVITGKGRADPQPDLLPRRAGVLRHQVPVWLRQPPLGAVVQQVAEAHLRHGGAGAIYVYLRRRPTARSG